MGTRRQTSWGNDVENFAGESGVAADRDGLNWTIGRFVRSVVEHIRARRGLVLGLIALCGIFALLGGVVAMWAHNSGLTSRIEARASAWVSARMPKPDAVEIEWRRVETALAGIDIAQIPLGEMDGPMATGGSIAAFGDGLIIMTARGRLGFMDLAEGTLSYSDLQAPMNEAGLEETGAFEQAMFSPPKFRVNDILLTRNELGRQVMLVNHHVVEGQRICTAVSSIGVDLVDGAPRYSGEWKRIYTVKPCLDLHDVKFNFEGHKSGGRMVEAGDGRIMMVVGAYGMSGAFLDRGEEIIEHDDWDLTRVLEIDLATGEASEFARGVRSPGSLLLDSKGRLWTSGSGPQGGDELNLIQEGRHYGWPHVSYGTSYGDGVSPRLPMRLNPKQGRHEGFEPPVMAFTPSIAPSQLLEVAPDSETFAAWQGDLLMGTLRGQSLYRIRLEGDRVVYIEPIRFGYRLRDLEWLPDGRIAVMADEDTLFIVRDASKANGGPTSFEVAGYDLVRDMAPAPSLADSSWKRELFTDRCGTCHALDGAEAVGPSLAGVIGRPIGGMDGYPYSIDLAQARGRWTLEKLEAFVRDPAAAGFPGSHMPPISDVEEDVYLQGILDFADDPEI